MSKVTSVNEKKLCSLRERLASENKSGRMSEKRYLHTLEVEKMAARLSELYAPEAEALLRAAALLHDVTKELSFAEHISVCEECGVVLTDNEYYAPKTLHAITAAAIIPKKYPEFAEEEIISSVRWHTTGRADMSLCEKLIYLADYIDMSRKFEDCVRLRDYFFSADFSALGEKERLIHLDKTLIMSYDMTIASLVDAGKIISPDTVEARNSLIIGLKKL